MLTGTINQERGKTSLPCLIGKTYKVHLGYIAYFIVPDQVRSDCKARAKVTTAWQHRWPYPPLVLYTGLRVTPGIHFFYPKKRFCSLLLPVSFQHLGSSCIPFLPLSLACSLSPKESVKVSQQVFWRAYVLWDNGRRSAGKGPGDSQQIRSSFYSKHLREIRQGRHMGSRDGV